MQKTILCALTITGLLSLGALSCSQQEQGDLSMQNPRQADASEIGQQATGHLNMQIPAQAGASEIVVIKIADAAGKPVSGVRIYGPGYLGDTTESGGLVTFFKEPGDYELTARIGKTGEPGFAETKGMINIVPSAIEFQAYDGVLPMLPPGQTFTGELAYKMGMTVRFSFKNTGNMEIVLYSPAPWEIRSRKGEIVFEPEGIPSIIKVPPVIELAPGESKEWSWNQQDKDGQQVSEGGYMVVLRCSKGSYGLGFSIVPEGMTP